MSNSQIAKILDAHNITHYTEHGRIYAISRYLKRYGKTYYRHEDLTGSTKEELLAWIGY